MFYSLLLNFPFSILLYLFIFQLHLFLQLFFLCCRYFCLLHASQICLLFSQFFLFLRFPFILFAMVFSELNTLIRFSLLFMRLQYVLLHARTLRSSFRFVSTYFLLASFSFFLKTSFFLSFSISFLSFCFFLKIFSST